MDIDDLRRALRAREAREDWFPVYEQALADAYRRHDVEAVAQMAVLAGARLLAAGRTQEALSQLEFGIRMSDQMPERAAHLKSVKASVLALQGDVERARAELDEAAALLGGADANSRAAIEHRTYRAMIRCIALDMPDGHDELQQPITRAEANGLPWLAGGLMAWLVPWLVAFGRRREASPWIEALTVQARAEGHVWRAADAVSFSRALAAVDGVRQDGGERDVAGNAMAGWRGAISDLRQAVLRRDWRAADASLAEIERLRDGVPPGLAEGADAFGALVRAHRDEEELIHLPPPRVATLNNLAAILAAAEVIALSGTQEDALHWQHWLDRHIPSALHTSLEWPVAADRVRSLVAARVGDLRRATQLGWRAIRWADDAGYPVEAALGRMQLSEFLALGSSSPAGPRWRQLRREARLALSHLGIDPLPGSYVATSVLALGRTGLAAPRLTPREIEVLALLAEGHSYRQIGERLAINWRTAQTHARNIYAKLEVPGKILAVARARDAGII